METLCCLIVRLGHPSSRDSLCPTTYFTARTRIQPHRIFLEQRRTGLSYRWCWGTMPRCPGAEATGWFPPGTGSVGPVGTPACHRDGAGEMLLDLRLTPPDLSLADNALAHRETKQLEGGSGGQSAARKGPRIPGPRGSSEGGRGEPGEFSVVPKPCRCFPSRMASPGLGGDRCGAALGWERGPSMRKEQSRAGREPLWRSPWPPACPGPLRALRGAMSSGSSGSGSCHCCPWERGRGRDAPLFSPGAAEPRACEAAPPGATSPTCCVWPCHVSGLCTGRSCGGE